MNKRWLGRRLAGLFGDERGFSLVEAMIALGIILTAVLGLAYTATKSFTDISYARQRQVAGEIASKMTEEARALSYDTVKKGLSDSDLSGDSNIVQCSSVYYFQSCSGETLAHFPGLPTTAPLVPHQTSFGPPDYPNTYTASVYVTNASNAPQAGAYRITVIVTWSSSERSGAANNVQSQTLVYEPTGSIDSSTHVGGAGQAFWFGAGSAGGGSIVITPNTGTLATGILNVPAWNSFTLDTDYTDGTLQEEQLTQVQGTFQEPGGRMNIGGTTTTTGELKRSTYADDDGASPQVPYSVSFDGNGSLGTTLSQCGGTPANCLKIQAIGSGTNGGSSYSAAPATSINVCNGQTDGLPCGYGSVGQEIEQAEVLDLTGSGLSTASIVDMKPPACTNSSASTVYGHRVVPFPGNDGVMREAAARCYPQVLFGALPTANNLPTKWSGYWVQLAANYAPIAQSEAGTDSTAPSVQLGTTGTISAWNGNGYTSTPITAAGGNVTISTLSACTSQGTGGSAVWARTDISGTLRWLPSSTNETFASGSTTTRTDATAVVGSPLGGSITYKVTKYTNSTCTTGPQVVADLTLTIDLGSVTTRTTYTPAS